jgi:hypothetical protein
MGHEAAVTKRKVLGKVEQCVEATNENIQQTIALTEKHNAFTQEMGTRLSAQGAWLERTERLVIVNRSAVERQIAALAEKCSRDLAEADRVNGALYDGLLRHLVALKNELAVAKARAEQFEQLGMVARLKVFFTGRLPEFDVRPVLIDYEALRGERIAITTELAGAPLQV